MKLKHIIVGLAAASLVSCASVKPHGWLDVAYVPDRVDDKQETNEVKVEVGANLETKISNLGIFTLGGDFRTYCGLEMFPYFNPHRQEYDIFAELNSGQWIFYARHMCSHPVNDVERIVYGEPVTQNGSQTLNTQYIVNHDSKTEIGVKVSF